VKTKLTRSPEEAAGFIDRGELVAFPTETVYGLGASVFDAAAIEKIFEAKRRPADNPLIVHVADVAEVARIARGVSAAAKGLMDAFFPGPLTLVLPKAEAVPLAVTAGLDTVGVRMPRLSKTRRFLALCSTPVCAPSANLSGRPSATTWEAVAEDLDGRIACILIGEPAEIGLESTVVDCVADPPVVLRQGAISVAQLRRIVPETIVGGSAARPARSPGTAHRHYTPRARVVVLGNGGDSEPGDTAYIGLTPPNFVVDLTLVCGSKEEYAAQLFAFFRECDRRSIATIYCESVTTEGIGAALMDRIARASSG
jgi:L-threonylcarbamoyladenylate synthase